MNCEQCKELLIDYAKGELENSQDVEKHLNICTACVRELENTKTVLQMVGEACEPAIHQLVNGIVSMAHKYGASEIHIAPAKGQVVVRYRIDGLLSPRLSFELKAHRAVMARLKMLADLSHLANHTQSGTFELVHDAERFNHCITFAPAANGEVAVIKILKEEKEAAPMEALGFDDDMLKTIDDKINVGRGVIVVLSPERKKCENILYALAQRLEREDWHIVMVEREVSRIIDGKTQLQVPRGKSRGTEQTLEEALLLSPDALIYFCEMTDLASFWSSAWLDHHIAIASHMAANLQQAIDLLQGLKVKPSSLTIIKDEGDSYRLIDDISVID